jgi:hypothetical protein
MGECRLQLVVRRSDGEWACAAPLMLGRASGVADSADGRGRVNVWRASLRA